MNRLRSKKMLFAAPVIAMALALSACGDSDDSSISADDNMTTTTEMTTTAEAMDGSDSAMLTPVGSACSQVPTSGEGSVAGMADDPVATAASNNPLLKTLANAVGQAGLVDTLNGSGPFTVFAPVDSAFAKLPSADLNALLADKAKLTDVLTYHVVSGKKTLDDLKNGDKITTVEGKDITVSEMGDTTQINGAGIICGNVPVSNGVVMLIDTVLMPPAS